MARVQRKRLIELADAVVVDGQDGKVRLDQSMPLVAAGATGGALWGALIGALFVAPLLGMAVGATGRELSPAAKGRPCSRSRFSRKPEGIAP